MATSEQVFNWSNVSDAAFRAWVSIIDTFFITTLGWTHSGDTGQADLTTMTVPASNTFLYKIYQPGDALTTFYIKFEFGSGTTSGTHVRMRWAAGTTTNGTGTLSGITTVSTGATLLPVSGNAANQDNCIIYLSGTTSRFTMAINHGIGGGSLNNNIWVNIERTHDSNGDDDSRGFTFAGSSVVNASGILDFWTVLFGSAAFRMGGTTNNTSSNPSNLMQFQAGQTTAMLIGTKVAVSPLFPIAGQFLYPLTGIVFHGSTTNEIGTFTTFQSILFATTMTFYGGLMNSCSVLPAPIKLAIRWE